MAKNSYCYQQVAFIALDKYAGIREKIRIIFDESLSRYGYRRIHSSLKNEEIKVSEKVIRRIIQEENLILDKISIYIYISHDMLFAGPVLYILTWERPILQLLLIYILAVVIFATLLYYLGTVITSGVTRLMEYLFL